MRLTPSLKNQVPSWYQLDHCICILQTAVERLDFLDAMAFNMEYAKWLDGHRLHLGRLQDAVENHLSENEIRFCVDNCMAHIDDFMHLKSMIVKYDVFHILSGLWKTPVERYFLWIGGFRPSELIKHDVDLDNLVELVPGVPALVVRMILAQIELFTDQQIMRIYELQNVILEGEKALSQEHAKVNQSLSDAIMSENLKFPHHAANYMAQMSTAMNKLSNFEDVVNQSSSETMKVLPLHKTELNGKKLIIISVYAPQELREKKMIWDYLILVLKSWNDDVIIMSDFNEVRTQDERHGSIFNAHGADAFNLFISSVGLEEVPLDGCKFTWCHKSGSKMSKLDRFLISEGLLNSCPNISSITLDRYLSDHRPILLRESHHDYGPSPFRFFHYWFELEGFDTFVKQTWNDAQDFVKLDTMELAQKAKIK
ncbi:RNA-directed DNA polymerase, eukaryota [Tanacetum coccineum]